MTDIAIAPSMAPGQDEQSVHLYTLRDNTPAWYTESPAELKLQMALMPLTIPKWFRYASMPARQSLKQIHTRSRQSLNQLDQLLLGLKKAAAFAEPLLVEAIEKKFGLRLDVRRVFYARKIELTECERLPGEVARSSAVALGPKFYFYKGVSLLEAALGNFTEDEALAPACEDCHLITRYNFHLRPEQAMPPPGDVKSLPVGIKAHAFAQLCRDLDLGAKYYNHVRSTLNAQIAPAVPCASSGKLYGAMITAHRNQLELAAQVAVMQQDIAHDSHSLIQQILLDQRGRQLDGEDILFSRYQLCTFTLESILIIGPVSIRASLRNVTVHPRRCLVYIPGDPQCVLKEYPNVAQFTDDLTTRLCSAEYRLFFSQFVPISEHQAFFTKLQALLDPKGAFTLAQDFDVASKSRINNTADYGYGAPLEDVWLDSAKQKIHLIMDNTSTVAVSTRSIDQRVYNASLSWWGNKAMDMLNLAAFVVPVLGEVMLAVGAVQMFYEFADGLEAWSDGQTREAWAHFSAVTLGIVGLALPKALLVGKDSAFIKRLVRIEFADGRVRLHDSHLGAFKHQITLPRELQPDARGLYFHAGEGYLPVEGGHYKIRDAGDDTRLIHPDGASEYRPRIRGNGAGAWAHEFEQPQAWDRRTLLRRIGHSVDPLNDSQLEQLRVMSGVTDAQLRTIYIDQQLPAPLFREGLRYFACHQEFEALLEQLRSSDPNALRRVSVYKQLDLIMRKGVWPDTKVVEIRNALGDALWRSSEDIAEKAIVVLREDDVHAGHILPSLLAQLDLPEARQMLGERIPVDTITLDFISGPQEYELPAHLQRPVRDRALEVPSDAKRLASYQRRLLQLANEHRGELIENDLAAGNASSDSNVQVVQRLFPGLPKLVVEELLANASSEELAHLGQRSYLPLRLAEEARRYQQRARILRAHAVLVFDLPLTMDAVRLALHTLAAVPGELDGIGIELRADSSNGPLLDRVGKPDAPKQFRLVRISLAQWEVRDGAGKVLYWRSDSGAFYSALWFATDGKFTHWEALKAATQALKVELVRQPLSEAATRRALGLQPIKPGFKSPMSLADGRFGYPLSPVGAGPGRTLACEVVAAKIYPSKTLEEVKAFLGLEGLGDADVLARLNELESEYEELQTTLNTWEKSDSVYARDRRTVANTIKGAWRRSSPQAFAADRTSIGHILDISDEMIGDLPPITANMDHIGYLRLRRMALSDDSLPFLQSFGGLRWLNMSGNRFTQLPEFAKGGERLTKLNLSRNDIRLTEQSRLRLEAMQQLKILNLGDNPDLGWAANLPGMRNLNQLYLQNTGTRIFPAGAERLLNLARIDLHSNRITSVPEYVYRHPVLINLHENPLSAATLERFQLPGQENPAQWGDHVTVGEARESWLSSSSTGQDPNRAALWDNLWASPESAAFFTVLADTTRCAEFRSAVTRPALAERVWDMVLAASESQAVRESLFQTADDRITCGDGSSVEFMNLESELMGAKALELAGQENAEGELITTARKLFRLHLVDAVAQRDVDARGPGFTEQVEVILAYRTRLADRLGLPVKSRDMLFPQQANVSAAAIDAAYAQVLRDERDGGDTNAFFVGREFWQKHLRQRYPQELDALMASGNHSIDEESTALFELSDLQGEQPSPTDSAALHDWQARHTQVVDRLVRLLGKRRDEILVDGVMQSAFYERELKRLGVTRLALETRALLTLTQTVLNNFAAEEGTAL